MRVIVFFDLPTVTSEDRRAYRKFRKYLIKTGFMMEQESVYSKLAVNGQAAESIADNIRKNKPDKGIVELMRITEKQYSKTEYIVGSKRMEILDTDERLVIL